MAYVYPQAGSFNWYIQRQSDFDKHPVEFEAMSIIDEEVPELPFEAFERNNYKFLRK